MAHNLSSSSDHYRIVVFVAHTSFRQSPLLDFQCRPVPNRYYPRSSSKLLARHCYVAGDHSGAALDAKRWWSLQVHVVVVQGDWIHAHFDCCRPKWCLYFGCCQQRRHCCWSRRRKNQSRVTTYCVSYGDYFARKQSRQWSYYQSR